MQSDPGAYIKARPLPVFLNIVLPTLLLPSPLLLLLLPTTGYYRRFPSIFHPAPFIHIIEMTQTTTPQNSLQDSVVLITGMPCPLIQHVKISLTCQAVPMVPVPV